MRAHLGFRVVRQRVVDARLEQMHFGEDHLVVELLELAQERLDERERLAVVVVVDVSACPSSVSPCAPARSHAYTRTHSEMRRVSRFCLRKMRFSALAHPTFSLVTSI